MNTNYEIRHAVHPDDFKLYHTERLRKEFLITSLFTDNSVKMVYSMNDRLIIGGAMPKELALPLEAIDPLKMPYFLSRREIGIFNVGGKGKITVSGTTYELNFKEALYIGMGDKEVIFESIDPAYPAKFYFNSAPAHQPYPDKKITKQEAIVVEMGSMEEANHRVINKMIVNQILSTCQLQMGMTELKPGSVWNTMPAHTHSRRMEAYFYFEVPEKNAICHFMGEPNETRHLWMHNEEAVISPSWSIHAGTATSNYTFIWGMGGENLDYGDQDFIPTTELK